MSEAGLNMLQHVYNIPRHVVTARPARGYPKY